MSGPYSKELSNTVMTKYLNKRIYQDIEEKGCVDLQKQNEYYMGYGYCNLSWIHNKLKRKNI